MATTVGIAGAGLLGRLLAWRLLRQGQQVTLFDRDNMAGENCAGRVAAAMLAPFSEAVVSERQVFDWGRAGIGRWQQWLEQLAADCGQQTYMQLNGRLVVAHAQDRANLQHFEQLLASKLPDQQQAIERLNGEGVANLEPVLAGRFQQGLFLAEEGCLDNWALLDNLAAAIQALGGQWHSETVIESIAPGVIHADGREHCFDQVIDTRGVGAKADFNDLRGVRGEVLWVQAPEVRLTRPVRLMHPRYQLYIAPKPNNVYVIGATEIESESMAAMTVRSSLELQSALYSVDTGFAEASVLKAYANCRPAFMNNLPRIEKSAGLMRVNGLYRHGYLLSPVVVDAAMAALDGHDDPVLVQRSPAQAVS
jgi:glycine oxidase